MKKLFSKSVIVLMLMFILIIMAIVGCGNVKGSLEDKKLQVAVTIVPQASFVEKVAGNLVDVVSIVPPGSSPTNYQPTPEEMINLENSSIYFSIGVPTEAANIMPNMVAESDVKVVALQNIVGEVYKDRYFGVEEDEEHVDHDHGEGTRDPHIWLSPKRVIIMVEAIRDELSLLDSDNAEIYAENATSFIEELEAVDRDIADMFVEDEHLQFIITHPSLGYFADDYGLEMISLEKDGKTATAAWLQEIIDFAVEKDIHVIFYQAEFDSTKADSLASAIDGHVVQLVPLSPDYINNLKIMANAFLENKE